MNYKDHSLHTVQLMTPYISSTSQSLLDLGCGTKESADFLMASIPEYWGVDYVNSGNDAVIAEFNNGDFPFVKADTIFCSGCLEYIEDIDAFIDKVCQSSRREIILSYCPLEYKSDIIQRKICGWKNHMSISELTKKLQLKGFFADKTQKFPDSHIIFKFINNRQIIIQTVISNHLTYLEYDALNDLMEAVAMTNELEGCIIEAGCALGGSGICMSYEKAVHKPLFIYDVFGMIPAPGEKDGKDVLERYDIIKQGKSQGIGGDLYYGYQENLMESVKHSFYSILGIQNLSDNNISFIKGLFQDTLNCDQPVALAHIDCDWYDSVMICLKRIVPHLIQGGILVIDDYYCWSGCRNAVDDYFKDKKEYFVFENRSRLHIIKK